MHTTGPFDLRRGHNLTLPFHPNFLAPLPGKEEAPGLLRAQTEDPGAIIVPCGSFNPYRSPPSAAVAGGPSDSSYETGEWLASTSRIRII